MSAHGASLAFADIECILETFYAFMNLIIAK